MKNDLQCFSIRAGSTETIKFEIYNTDTNARIIDFTGYDLNLLILKNNETKEIVKQFGSTTNATTNTIDVVLTTNETKSLASGEYFWLVALKYPNSEIKLYVGKMPVEWGKEVIAWL